MQFLGSQDDIVQDLYTKILEQDLLAKYDPRKARLTTWLFAIVRMIVLGRVYIQNKEILCGFPDDLFMHEAQEEEVPIQGNIDPVYEGILLRNQDSDELIGTAAELKEFKSRFSGSRQNKRHLLQRRKNKGFKTSGYTMLDIFDLLYEGFSNREIALMFGVTDMAICHLKHRLVKSLIRSGFRPVRSRSLEAVVQH
jgi:DNA-directed RNA polymerase specialized sigma24 family protein